MPSSRIVAVFGATGLQGSAVVDRLLQDGTFTPRAISRDPGSEASLRLKERGVEVFKANSSDRASLVNALRGSEAVFAVTVPSFGPPSLEGSPSEITQGKNIVDAAKQADVKFFVFSSLPSLSKLSGGKYKVQHYDDKKVIEDYLKESGLPHAFLHLGAFTENLWRRKLLKETPTGFNISIPYSPTALQAFTWVEHDVSESALALFKSYTDTFKAVSGKSYPIVTAMMSFPELAAMIAKSIAVDVTFTSVASAGNAQFDDMFAALAEYNGLYTSTPVPNPDLIALGAKFGTMEEFMEKEVKKRFGQ
ncbi:NAD(P)-binding protein [Mycena sanguinolenta]|nr:NAD(P)-binding protein [Mycena sanguinolenta]